MLHLRSFATRRFLALFLATFGAGEIQPAFATEAEAVAEAESYTGTLNHTGWKIRFRQLGLLKLGKSVEFFVPLEKGRTYVFSLGGCHDAYDLDMALWNDDVTIAHDTDTSRSARFEVEAPETKKFRVFVKMRDCADDGAHFCLLVGELFSANSGE